MKIYVLGLGNVLLQDDGIGVRLVQELQKKSLPGHAEAWEIGTAIFSLPYLIQGEAVLLAVDAVFKGGKPGSYYTLSPLELENAVLKKKTSLHDFRLQDLLALPGLAKNVMEWKLFGIEPAGINFGSSLTDPLSRRLPLLLKALRQEIQDLSLKHGLLP